MKEEKMEEKKVFSDRKFSGRKPEKKFERNGAKKPYFKKEPSRKFKKLNIDYLDNECRGVSEFKGTKYLVKNVLEGERVEVELPNFKNKERALDYIYTPSKIITASKDRVNVSCPYFNECSNCNLLHSSYNSQIIRKKAMLSEALKKAGVSVDGFVEGKPFGYRNKVHLAFTDVGGKALVGFFNEETHRVIPVKKCLLHGQWFRTLVETLNEWAGDNHLTAFKPWDNEGLLRFAVCRYLDGNLMVTIVARENVRCLDSLYDALTASFDSVSLWLNINTQENSKVFSERFIHIDGKNKLESSLLGISFSLSPNSFFQVNEHIASRIYADVVSAVKESAPSQVVDLYSGIGLTSILFAKNGFDVTSTEIVVKAVEDAKELAEKNGVSDKINFVCGDCNNILPRLEVRENSVFFVDPPRKGLGPQVCRSILKKMPGKIIYLSCGPDSLADDLKTLMSGGYTVEKATGYDMFPNTKHMETLVILSKGK